MRVLFIFSGNNVNGISPIIKAQADSLIKQGIEVDFYPIIGKGYQGYLKNIFPLKKYLKINKFDIVHTHYSLSSYVASLAGAKPMVVSLMGSDVMSKGWAKILIRIFNSFFWESCIVKSSDMKKSLGIENTYIIPNGVNFKLHQPSDQNKALKELGWNLRKKHIIFAANLIREEKNYQLAEKAFQLLNKEDVNLHFLQNVPHEKIPVYFAASSITLLTSLWEGSPNVVKEAMACNCPIVATDVGDVQWLFGNEPGHFITGFEPEDVAEKIKMALEFSEKYGRTNGRKRIMELGLDAETVANKIIDIYKKAIKK
ncbi:MAG: glycosyltransferase family 4 protein [Bacteroidales bacterium]|nr:glycosyltransferase family 4 protein [Bacteroidales bacterium]